MSSDYEPTLEDFVRAFCRDVERAEWKRDPANKGGQQTNGHPHPFVTMGPPSAWLELRRWAREFRTFIGPDGGCV